MRHPLPYAFAKAHQVLLQDDGRQRVLWTTPATPVSTLSEVLRVHSVDLWQREAAPQLQTRIAAAYAGGESSAAAVVGSSNNAVNRAWNVGWVEARAASSWASPSWPRR